MPFPIEELGLLQYWLLHHLDRLNWAQVLAWHVRHMVQ